MVGEATFAKTSFGWPKDAQRRPVFSEFMGIVWSSFGRRSFNEGELTCPILITICHEFHNCCTAQHGLINYFDFASTTLW